MRRSTAARGSGRAAALRATVYLAALAGGVTRFSQPASATEAGHYALLVGVEKYDESELAPLDWAEDDVEAIGRALEKLGFSVVTMTSTSPVAARRPVLPSDILTQLDKRLADREKADTVVVAFSGHGVQFKADPVDANGAKELWFCPERARPVERTTMLAMTEVLRRLDACAAGRKLLLVDACRNDFEPPNGSKSGRVIELPAAGVKRPAIPAGMVAVFSCRPGEQSFEIQALGHSIFSHHLIEFLEGRAPADRYPRGEVGISELTSYVRTRTRDTAEVKLDRMQIPDVVVPAGAFAEWPLGRIGEDPRPAARDLASVDRRPAMQTPKPKPAASPAPSPVPVPQAAPGDVIENSIGIKLVRIKAGDFEMGSDDSGDEQPIHRVRITKPFLMGQTEVTQGQFRQVMGTRPWNGKKYVKEGGNVAASYVSWDDAVEFCRKLTHIERQAGRLPAGGAYRLPTEAEWEYACRAGTKTRWSFGDDDRRLGEYVWFDADEFFSGETYAREVGRKKPNPWSLFDMHGNVDEWCSDGYAEDYYAKSPTSDPKGPSSDGPFRVRVLRGGFWFNNNASFRSAGRDFAPHDVRSETVGVRVVCDLE